MIKLNFSVDEIPVKSKEYAHNDINFILFQAMALVSDYANGPYKLTIKKTVDEVEE